MRYQNTRLWKAAFDTRKNDPYAEERSRLAAAYGSFWENGCVLAGQIAKSLPNLTLHDESHFDALWDRADQIAGPEYTLTPLETFVLGGAILLHDAGHAISAYPGGIAQLKSTPEWRDALADALGGDDPPTGEIDESVYNRALFETLRQLHAKQATEIGQLEFRNHISGNTFHLISNDLLRVHLTRVIGLVAASHHWDIADLEERLPKVVGALGTMPAEWRVRPIPLACLLRCADAIQLDQQRAPDFLYAMLQLKGVSEQHWRAQNRLAAPATDADDPGALVMSSTTAFSEKDADAWWIAYDAIRIADRELAQSKALLRDLGFPKFAIERIRDCDSPLRLSGHIPTIGWKPVSAEVTVRRVDHVVRMLGGEQLYGSRPWIVIRELVQNSVDAIKMRREADETWPSEQGHVVVRLTESEERVTLEIEDNGIGMSEAALVGPFLEFGSGYWDSGLVREERPGLSARSRRRIGRYGIGFFSVFMLTDCIDVISRAFDKGSDTTRTLRFNESTNLRPILLDQRHNRLSPETSTRISLQMSAQSYEKLTTISSTKGEVTYSLSELISQICTSVDCDIYLEDKNGRVLVHGRKWYDDIRTWLSRALPAISPEEHPIAVDLLELIDPENPGLGLASIAIQESGYSSFNLDVATVGGLAAGRLNSELIFRVSEYFGSIEHIPAGPRRDGGTFLDPGKVAAWATRQCVAIAKLDIGDETKNRAASLVSFFGGDPRPIANCRLDREFVGFSEVANLLGEGRTLHCPLPEFYSDAYGTYVTTVQIQNNRSSGLEPDEWTSDLNILELMDGAFPNSNYSQINTDGNFHHNSFFGLVSAELSRLGKRMKVTISEDRVIATYVGKDSPREKISSGDKIKMRCAVVAATS